MVSEFLSGEYRLAIFLDRSSPDRKRCMPDYTKFDSFFSRGTRHELRQKQLLRGLMRDAEEGGRLFDMYLVAGVARK
jgi:hypothetical protein